MKCSADSTAEEIGNNKLGESNLLEAVNANTKAKEMKALGETIAQKLEAEMAAGKFSAAAQASIKKVIRQELKLLSAKSCSGKRPRAPRRPRTRARLSGGGSISKTCSCKRGCAAKPSDAHLRKIFKVFYENTARTGAGATPSTRCSNAKKIVGKILSVEATPSSPRFTNPEPRETD